MQPSTRRQFLVAAGTAALSGVAGCGEDGSYDRTAGIAQRTTDWPTIGHGYAHTATLPGRPARPKTPNRVATRHRYARGTPIIVGDRVIAPVGDGVTCYRLGDGEELWQDIPESRVGTTPTVVDNRVFVASGHGGCASSTSRPANDDARSNSRDT